MLLDSVMYCGEKDMYSARLEYLHTLVDKFIVIESASFHNGVARECTFEDDFKDSIYRDRIIYRKIDCNDALNLPEYQSYNGGDTFARENYQRNYIKTVLQELGPFNQEDKIMICDVDEIPSIDFLKEYIPKRVVGIKQYIFIGMKMYYFNHTVKFNGNFYQPILANINFVLSCKNLSVQIRKTLFNNVFINNSGWHLSYFMPTDKIIDKIKHFLHCKWYTDDKYSNASWINSKIKSRETLFDNRGDNIVYESETDIPVIFLKLENYGDAAC